MPSLHSPVWFPQSPPSGQQWHGMIQVLVKNVWVRSFHHGDLAWITSVQPSTAGMPLNVYVPPPFATTTGIQSMHDRCRLLGVVDNTKIEINETGRVIIEGPILGLEGAYVSGLILLPSYGNPRVARTNTIVGQDHYHVGFGRAGDLNYSYIFLDRIQFHK